MRAGAGWCARTERCTAAVARACDDLVPCGVDQDGGVEDVATVEAGVRLEGHVGMSEERARLRRLMGRDGTWRNSQNPTRAQCAGAWRMPPPRTQPAAPFWSPSFPEGCDTRRATSHSTRRADRAPRVDASARAPRRGTQRPRPKLRGLRGRAQGCRRAQARPRRHRPCRARNARPNLQTRQAPESTRAPRDDAARLGRPLM